MLVASHRRRVLTHVLHPRIVATFPAESAPRPMIFLGRPAPASGGLGLTDVGAGRCRDVCRSGCHQGTGCRVDSLRWNRLPVDCQVRAAFSCFGWPSPHGCWRTALPWRVSLWLPLRYGLPSGCPLLKPPARGLPGARFDRGCALAGRRSRNDGPGTSRVWPSSFAGGVGERSTFNAQRSTLRGGRGNLQPSTFNLEPGGRWRP